MARSDSLRRAADALFALGEAEVVHGTRPGPGGGAIHHVEAGAGAPLILLHGAGGGSANWYRLIGGLARDFRVVAPDLPGFGESDAVAVEAPLGGHAASIVAGWLDGLAAPPWVIAGTSFGGLVALRLAQLRRADVAALIVIDAVGLGRQVPWLIRVAADPRLGRLLLAPSRAGTRILFDTLLVSGSGSITPAHRTALLEYLWRSDAAGGAVQLRRSLRLFTGWRGQHEVLTDEELARLEVPTLVVWGERDRFVHPEHGRWAAQRMPAAEFRLVPGAGHSPNWESPAVLLTMIRGFLDVQPGPRA
jgi:pimeloyl-ACP methyl ester carboxylesterase